MHEYTNVNSNLCEYILGVHHELSQNLESKIFRRFLIDNFDIKETSDLYLNKLVLPLSKIWGYRSVRIIFNLKGKDQRICLCLTFYFAREHPWKINITF